MTYFPPDYTHNLLPIDAQMMLRDAHERCRQADDDQRIDIIETAERRVREMCPDAYRGDE
jgi:hypothetical protein